MNMTRIFGLVLAVVGIALLVLGINATQSITEQASETFFGRFTDTTTWYILGGIAAMVGGGAMALFGGRRTAD